MSELNQIIKHLTYQINNNGTVSLKTSGTTGTPKVVSKNIDLLYRNSKLNKEHTNNDVFGFLYNLDSWAATSVIIYCIKNQITPYNINIDSPIFEQLQDVTHLSITPTFLQVIAMNLQDKKVTNIQKIILGGEYSTQETIDLCKKIFPKSKIVTIYSSTETGDIASCSDMIEGFSKDKFEKYTFDDSNCLIKDGNNTGDIWELHNGRYIFKGRIDSCIKVAGNLISLYDLENKIKNITNINDCVCIETDVPIIGKSYKLLYVGEEKKIDIKNKLKQALHKYEMPVLIKNVEAIGFGKNYKKERQ
tara:strand:- start:504 stop:1415 length:912 start_codon:yes stop_codon:yes gene_type:complete